jgi:hypothetical protein
LTTRGDAFRTDDEPVLFSQVLGKIIQIERHGVCFVPPPTLRGGTLLLSRLIRHFCPLKTLMLRLHSILLKVNPARYPGVSALI